MPMLAMVGKQVLVRDPPHGLFMCAATADFGVNLLIDMDMCVRMAKMDAVVVAYCSNCWLGALCV